MGTTTFYLRHNDLKRKLSNMNRKDLDRIDTLSPYKEDHFAFGWSTPLELHNGNVYPLVFWKGRLMRLEDAPKKLNRKYYDRLKGRPINEYEWTVLKRLLLYEINRLDKEFKKSLKKGKTKD